MGVERGGWRWEQSSFSLLAYGANASCGFTLASCHIHSRLPV